MKLHTSGKRGFTEESYKAGFGKKEKKEKQLGEKSR